MRAIRRAMLQQDQALYDMDPMRPPLPRFTRGHPTLLLQVEPAPCPLLRQVDIGRSALVTSGE